MKNLRFATLLLSIAVSATGMSACAPVQTTKDIEYSHQHDGKLVYIDEEMRYAFSIPDFPADESEEYHEDFKVLHGWQEQRTEAQCFAAAGQEYASIQETYPAYKKFFDSLSYQDKEFLHRVYEDAHTINKIVKARFSRPRPFHTAATLEPCANIGRINGYAYPSGHATMAGTFEGMMLIIDPDNEKGIKDATQRAGMYRVLAGVHHPTDIRAGYKLGRDIFDTLKKNGNFMKKLNSLHEKYVKYKKAH